MTTTTPIDAATTTAAAGGIYLLRRADGQWAAGADAATAWAVAEALEGLSGSLDTAADAAAVWEPASPAQLLYECWAGGGGADVAAYAATLRVSTVYEGRRGGWYDDGRPDAWVAGAADDGAAREAEPLAKALAEALAGAMPAARRLLQQALNPLLGAVQAPLPPFGHD